MEVHSRSQNQVETKDHVPIEYVPEDILVVSIKEQMESISLSHCISRVSEENLKGNGEQYFPMLVSIGPFHHGKETLKAMEDQKWCYLNTLLCRNPNLNVDVSLDKCLKALRRLEGKARKCYAENINMESDKFVEMMLVDGCFIIELFLKFAIKGLRRRDDPCFSSIDRFFRLTSDLILLENQIPFFILEQLFYLVPIPKLCSQSPTQLALRFFRKVFPGVGEIPPERVLPNIHHLLDLIRQFYLPTIPGLPSRMGQKNLQSATDLQAAGIKFKKEVAESLLNMEFDDGVFKIPPLRYHIYTETLFTNLIALEQCGSQYTKYITSYAFLMRCLIQDKNDVRLLRQKGILIISRDKQEDILNMFKKLHVDTNLKDFYYRGLCERINSPHRNTKLQALYNKLTLLCCK